MRVEIEVEGLSELTKQLAALEDDAEEAISDTINMLALRTVRAAKEMIQQGPATGRIYEKYRPRRTHRASAPGEAPMTDTGRLANSIDAELSTKALLLATVGTNVEYGRYLQFGTPDIAPRPWLDRALITAAQQTENDLKQQLEARL